MSETLTALKSRLSNVHEWRGEAHAVAEEAIAEAQKLEGKLQRALVMIQSGDYPEPLPVSLFIAECRELLK